MKNRFFLEYMIKEKGFNNSDIAKALGICDSSFYKKRTGANEFTNDELKKLKSLLNLDNDTFIKLFFE